MSISFKKLYWRRILQRNILLLKSISFTVRNGNEIMIFANLQCDFISWRKSIHRSTTFSGVSFHLWKYAKIYSHNLSSSSLIFPLTSENEYPLYLCTIEFGRKLSVRTCLMWEFPMIRIFWLHLDHLLHLCSMI